MADTSGMAEIRGIDIDKLAKGFADEEIVFKKFVVNTPTSAREIRWYKKTAGFLDSTDSTGITTSHIANTSFRSRPVSVEQSWTRTSSYVKKYFVESPIISDEDIKDSDVDILATNVRDLVRAVGKQIDQRIIDVITEATTSGTPNPTTVNTAASTGPGWNVDAIANPILDIMAGKQTIRSYGYNPENCILALNSIEHKYLLNYLISVKGSSIPNWSSSQMDKGIVMTILGCNVVVSENVPTDWAIMWVPDRAATWKTFIPLTSTTISDPGIGTKIRVWEEGEAILTDPRAVHVISNTYV